MDTNIREVIIIGSGPAGLTAALYAARAELKPLVIAGLTPGGQLMLTSEVENFPGFEQGIQGPELMNVMIKQVERFGAELIYENVESVSFAHEPFVVKTEKEEYRGRTVIIATGAEANWLNLPNEQRLRGKGVSACATCLPVGSTIIANSSPKTIESIEEGQYVLTHKGDFQPVFGQGNRHYKGKLIQIIPRYFREEPTLLTPEHPVLTATLKRGTGSNYWKTEWSMPEWTLAGELNSRHVLLYPIIQGIFDREFIRLSDVLGLSEDDLGQVHYPKESVTARPIPDKIAVDNDFMRLAGYFLAEGCITGRGINFYFGPKDQEYVKDVVAIMERLFGYIPKVKKEGSVYRIEAYAGILRDLFEKLFGKYSYNKSVPHWFMFLPFEKQAELIKGYWRGDGGTKKLGFVLVTNSPKLVAQFKMILLRLDIIPQILKQSKERLNRTVNLYQGRRIEFKHDRYQIMLGGQWLQRASEIIGVAHPLVASRTRIHEHGWIKDGYAYLPIAKLEQQDYNGQVHNIAVTEHNSYVTSGVTVHNCDGFFFKDKDVVVIGGGDSAMEEANFLTKFAKHVTVIHRRSEFRASKIMLKRAQDNPKIEFVTNVTVIDVLGEDSVTGVRIKDNATGQEREIAAQGYFAAIGHTPATKIFREAGIDTNEKGYIIPKEFTMTNIPGVFVAGDVHDHRYRQAITAAGEGCAAALDAEKYLASREGQPLPKPEQHWGEGMTEGTHAKSSF
jgi:thioredoxin reductase/intein/homing endonuclease